MKTNTIENISASKTRASNRAALVFWALIISLLCTNCQRHECIFEPVICHSPHPGIAKLPTPFPPFSLVERAQDWGKELFMGKAFAREMDLYRALTCFKRALILIPKNLRERRQEIEYDIFLAYYMAKKHQEAVEAFETSSLVEPTENFPASFELLTGLYDCYIHIDNPERACRVLSLIEAAYPATASNLSLETAIEKADFEAIMQTPPNTPAGEAANRMLADYRSLALSESKARTLNAVLPGAGYYYVGQKKTALTSFIINALFIGAAYQLFDRGYIPAGLIVASLETGWYFGGINGAGLAAREFNERLYENLGRETLIQNRLFPILMFQAGF